MQNQTINFYGHNNPYGEFSNFYPAEITIDGVGYKTSEHYFQSMKYFPDNMQYYETIRNAESASKSAILGRSRKIPMRKDWENVKDSIMADALFAKFTQHPNLQKILLDTGDNVLVEHTVNDRYWGDGGDGSGKNMLGKLLVNLRNQIKIMKGIIQPPN